MKKTIIIIIIILLLIGGFLYFRKSPETSKEPNVFFLKNDDNKYLLFSEDGKRFSDAIYDDVLDYILSSTLVYRNSLVSIIDKKGKELAGPNEYDDIVRYAAFYKATKKDKNYLLDNNAKVITDVTTKEIYNFKGANNFVIVADNDEYIIYLYNGKKIKTFKKIDDNIPTVNALDNDVSIYYNEELIIFDANNGQILYDDKSDYQYCINDIKDDILLLNSCSTKEIIYKILKDQEMISLSDKCLEVSLNDQALECTMDDGLYLLNKDYEPSLKIEGVNYRDENNYLKQNGEDVEIYEDGKKVDTISQASLVNNGYQRDAYYIILKDNLYYYYDGKEKVISEGYDDAKLFMDNDLALVKKDGKEFLIDRKGEAVTKKYQSVAVYQDFYITLNESYGLLNHEGKEILKDIYDEITIHDNNYALITKGNHHLLYDIDEAKVLAETTSSIEIAKQYYKVDDTYYTYNGVEIYKQNKSE